MIYLSFVEAEKEESMLPFLRMFYLNNSNNNIKKNKEIDAIEF